MMVLEIKSMANTDLWNGGVLRYEVPKDEVGNYVKDWHATFNTLYYSKRALFNAVDFKFILRMKINNPWLALKFIKGELEKMLL